MFSVSEAEATAIRDAFHQRGEFAAAAELRRMFPGIRDIGQARERVRIIAGWKPSRPGVGSRLPLTRIKDKAGRIRHDLC